MQKETYRIGELAQLADVTRRTVHYYINKGLIPPAKGTGVNSYYTTDHLCRIRLIRELQESYLPLEEIRKIIVPLDPEGVVHYLEQHKRKPPAEKNLPAREQPGEIDARSSGAPVLYKRIDLGKEIELHFCGANREEAVAPALPNRQRQENNQQQPVTCR